MNCCRNGCHGVRGKGSTTGSDCEHLCVDFVRLRECLDLRTFLQHGLIETDRTTPAVWPRIGPDEFIQIRDRDGIGYCTHRRVRDLCQEVAFPTRKQHLGYARSSQKADVPSPTMRDICEAFQAKTWQAHLNRGQAENIFGMGRRETENRSPADVLPAQMDGAYIQVSNQLVKILGRGLLS